MSYQHLLRQYREGMITKLGLVPACLAELDDGNADALLGELLTEAEDALLDFVNGWQDGPKLVFGDCPGPTGAQVALARRWLICGEGDKAIG